MAIWRETVQSEPIKRAEPELTRVSPIHERKEISAKPRNESVVSAGVTVEGKISGEGDLRIAGKFKGDIQIKGDLNIEKGAHVGALIGAASVTVEGTLDGNVVASSQVKLLESSELNGDIKASTLIVAAGSKVRGNVEIGPGDTEAAKVHAIRPVEKAQSAPSA
jgi:cytoskeletal protein CcmA (bactofilin family)